MKRRILNVEFSDTIKGHRLTVTGRDAQTLLLLKDKGIRGVTAYDFRGGPPFRLPAYVHNLRKLGLLIETRREPHEGGQHARYVLHSAVCLLTTKA